MKHLPQPAPSFCRYVLGEGIEKKAVDLAKEVEEQKAAVAAQAAAEAAAAAAAPAADVAPQAADKPKVQAHPLLLAVFGAELLHSLTKQRFLY
jgi:hypothetical protein